MAADVNNSIVYQEYDRHLLNVWRLYDKLRPAARVDNFRKLSRYGPSSCGYNRHRPVGVPPGVGAFPSRAVSLRRTATRTLARTEIAAVRQLLAAEIPPDQAASMRKLSDTLADLCRRMDDPSAADKP